MKLTELAKSAIQEVVKTVGDCEISNITMDSRVKNENGLFFCVSGARFDGHAFAGQAIANGASALVVEKYLEEFDVPQIIVYNTRKAMPLMASAFFGYPARKLKMLGITGTKGKTTTSFLVKAIMEAAGYKVGLIGTTGNMIGNEYIKTEFTTPEPIELHRMLRQMVDAGVQVVSMEVSAHALEMGRLEGIVFEAGCYTNLSQDHLDLFGTMERYFECKKSFFTPKWLNNAAFNLDEETTPRILDGIKVPYSTFGICTNTDIYARDIEISENGVSFLLKLFSFSEIPINLKLTGMFNVYNALAATAVGLICGLDPEQIKRGLESVTNVPGRAEMLDTGTDYKVLLDYSHSPDALQNILTTVREFCRGRIICLFGCGGDRDQGKRPIMGEISGRMADYSILTSDNPRTEDPMDILRSIEEGIRRTNGKYTVIENRREAIRFALNMAREGDIVILAGKGHETYQEIMGIKRPFNEKTVVRELLEEMKG